MVRNTRWYGRGRLFIEATRDSGGWYDIGQEEHTSDGVGEALSRVCLDNGVHTLEVYFTEHGETTPQTWNAPEETHWDRYLDKVYLDGVRLDATTSKMVFRLCYHDIMDIHSNDIEYDR